jgi:hypothetical protein
MNQDSVTALKKLIRTVAAVAEDVAQLRIDVAELQGAVGRLECKVTILDRRLGSDAGPPGEENSSKRDLDLERQVFGDLHSARKVMQKQTKRRHKRDRKTP